MLRPTATLTLLSLKYNCCLMFFQGLSHAIFPRPVAIKRLCTEPAWISCPRIKAGCPFAVTSGGGTTCFALAKFDQVATTVRALAPHPRHRPRCHILCPLSPCDPSRTPDAALACTLSPSQVTREVRPLRSHSPLPRCRLASRTRDTLPAFWCLPCSVPCASQVGRTLVCQPVCLYGTGIYRPGCRKDVFIGM
jgi:hypothetical protein